MQSNTNFNNPLTSFYPDVVIEEFVADPAVIPLVGSPALSGCVDRENPWVSLWIKALLIQMVNADTRFSFLQFEPTVTINPGRISFDMTIRFDDRSGSPPLFAHVFTVFGLKIRTSVSIFDAEVAAYNVATIVTPIPPFGVPDPNKEEQVFLKIRDNIKHFVDLGVMGFVRTPANTVVRKVSIERGGFNNLGTVKFTFCASVLNPQM